MPEEIMREADAKVEPTKVADKLVVDFSEVRVDDLALVGGKGANLGELAHVSGIKVPPGFIVTTNAYRRFLEANPQLKKLIYKELADLTSDTPDYVAALSKAGNTIRKKIRSADNVIPEEIVREVHQTYEQLEHKNTQPDFAVAVRSSASAEDLPDASFAGQQDTYLNVRGQDDVFDAVRRCWASLFTDRAISYRLEKGFDHFAVEIAVVVQQMIRSAQSGTAFSVDIETGWNAWHGTTKGVVYLDIGEGLGEAIVSGRQTPDSYLMAVSPTGKMVILEKNLGAKEEMIVYDEGQQGGTVTVSVPEERRQRFSVTDEQAIEIGEAVQAITEYYNDLRDVELALDDNGELWITQARPETVFASKSPDIIEQKKKVVCAEIAAKGEVLFKGVPGAGAACGKVVLIDAKEPEELSEQMNRVREGDILCAEFTTPDMVPAMKIAGGFITAVGGTTSHAAIVARELRKPAVVGVGNGLVERLRRMQQEAKARGEDLMVTVDANNGLIYGGQYALDEILEEVGHDIDLEHLPVTKTKVGLIVANPAVARMFPVATHPAHYGVSLMRAEFALAEISIHPQALLAYDEGAFNPGGHFESQSRLRKAITERIRGYKTGKQFYVEMLSRAVASIAATQTQNQMMIYRTTDFKSNEYREMLGGSLFEYEEPNPMLGFRGEGRMIDPEYAAVFRWELEALKRARSLGYKNVALMLPVVRTPQELRRALDFIGVEGLKRGQDGLQVGIMVEVPYNALNLEEFLLDKQGQKQVDFISIGSNDLTQFILATGRDNDRMREIFDEADPAVIRALEIVITMAKKLNVKTGLCGQRPSNDPKFAAKLVQLGIDSIGVADTSYVQVIEAVAAAEKEMTSQTPQAAKPDTTGDASPLPETPCIRIRSNDIWEQIGNHPLLLAQNAAKAEQMIVDQVSAALLAAAKEQSPESVLLYSTNDSSPVEFFRLKGGPYYEPKDENPLMGFSGATRLVDSEYERFFRWELQGLKKAMDSGVQFRIELTQVRNLNQLDRVLEIIAEEKLESLPKGLEIAIPASIILPEEFLKRDLQFASINEPKLATYVLAADLNNPKPLLPADEIAETVQNTRRLINGALRTYNLELLEGPKL